MSEKTPLAIVAVLALIVTGLIGWRYNVRLLSGEYGRYGGWGFEIFCATFAGLYLPFALGRRVRLRLIRGKDNGPSPDIVSKGAGPYRGHSALPARFVCVVCFQTATVTTPGVCLCSGSPTGSPRLPLDSAEVVQMLSKAAADRFMRRRKWGIAGAVIGSLTVSLCVCLALGLSIDPRGAGSSRFQRGAISWFLVIAVALLLPSLAVVCLGPKEPPAEPQALLRWLHVRVLDAIPEPTIL